MPSFRPATEPDLPAISRSRPTMRISRARPGFSAELSEGVLACLRAIGADPNNELWVGEQDGAVVASFQLTLIPGLARGGCGARWSRRCGCAPILRGKGIGAQLSRGARPSKPAARRTGAAVRRCRGELTSRTPSAQERSTHELHQLGADPLPRRSERTRTASTSARRIPPRGQARDQGQLERSDHRAVLLADPQLVVRVGADRPEGSEHALAELGGEAGSGSRDSSSASSARMAGRSGSVAGRKLGIGWLLRRAFGQAPSTGSRAQV